MRASQVAGDGRQHDGWVYFYSAPLGQAEKIPSGGYLDHVKARWPFPARRRRRGSRTGGAAEAAGVPGARVRSQAVP